MKGKLNLDDRILYQDVYSYLENLCFFNIPEFTNPSQKSAKELIYSYLERDTSRSLIEY